MGSLGCPPSQRLHDWFPRGASECTPTGRGCGAEGCPQRLRQHQENRTHGSWERRQRGTEDRLQGVHLGNWREKNLKSRWEGHAVSALGMLCFRPSTLLATQNKTNNYSSLVEKRGGISSVTRSPKMACRACASAQGHHPETRMAQVSCSTSLARGFCPHDYDSDPIPTNICFLTFKKKASSEV